MTVVLSYGWGERPLAELSREGRIELAARAHALELLGQPWPDRGRADLNGWSEFGKPELYRDRSKHAQPQAR